MNYYENKAKNLFKETLMEACSITIKKLKYAERLGNPYANLEICEALNIELEQELNKKFENIKKLILRGNGL